MAIVMHNVEVGDGGVALRLASLHLCLLQRGALGEGVDAQDLGLSRGADGQVMSKGHIVVGATKSCISKMLNVKESQKTWLL